MNSTLPVGRTIAWMAVVGMLRSGPHRPSGSADSVGVSLPSMRAAAMVAVLAGASGQNAESGGAVVHAWRSARASAIAAALGARCAWLWSKPEPSFWLRNASGAPSVVGWSAVRGATLRTAAIAPAAAVAA